MHEALRSDRKGSVRRALRDIEVAVPDEADRVHQVERLVLGGRAARSRQRGNEIVHSPIYLLALAGLPAMLRPARRALSQLPWLASLVLLYFVLKRKE